MEIKANPYVLTSEFDDLHLLDELCEKLKTENYQRGQMRDVTIKHPSLWEGLVRLLLLACRVVCK